MMTLMMMMMMMMMMIQMYKFTALTSHWPVTGGLLRLVYHGGGLVYQM